ncbi:MAG: HAMP domain-containing sensor histidine kinase [Polyangia bacterium]
MARILIVDDDALNRELLRAYLHDSGHVIIEADSGERAVQLARTERVDLVLCDVVMPSLSGFDVTLKLKAEAADHFLPVILLTSLSDPSSRLLGLRSGADDFLVKPIDRLELLARVSNLLRLRNKEIALVQRNIDLIELQRRRDDMAAMIVHDLKNPMAVILANLSVLQCSADKLDSDDVEALTDSITAGRRMQRLLSNLLDQARLEATSLELNRQPVKLARILESLLGQRSFILRARNIVAKIEAPPELEMQLDSDLLARGFENILDNSIRYTPSGGVLELSVEVRATDVSIRIGNSGPAIPVEARQRIFEKYSQAGPASHGTAGLGLYFCRLVVEAHGGHLDVEETERLPVVFHVRLPLDGLEHPAHDVE